MGESRHSSMEKSPCLECDLLHQSKNNSKCVNCKPVKQYADRMAQGGDSVSVPIEVSDMATRGRENLWTKDEIEFLRENYCRLNNRELASELGRTESAVVFRLSKLKLRRRKASAGKKAIKTETVIPSEASPEPIGSDSVTLFSSSDNLPMVPNKDFLIVDFSDHPDLFNKLKLLAKENFRPPEYEIFYLIDKASRDAVCS